MIVKTELVKKVRNYFNLNLYETKVWLALLSKGIASASEIAELSGVPRSRTYDVLESLEKQGYVVMKLGKPIKYIAVKPEVVVEKQKNNVTREAEEKIDVIDSLKGTHEYEQLELLHKQGITPVKPEDLSGAIKGRSNIYAHLKTIIGNAQKEVAIATNFAGLRRKSNFLRELSKKLARKGVKVKVGLNASEEEIKKISLENAEIKPLSLNARFVLVDGKHLVFMLVEEAETADEEIGIWINSDFFTTALKNLFELAWQGK